MDFQTPEYVCKLMMNLVEKEGYPKTILEPTQGDGNLVRAILNYFPFAEILAPNRFEELPVQKVDWVIANPPFTPMKQGYQMLERFFDFSGNVVVIMPWLALINSEKRTKAYIKRGLKEVVHLPRRVFPGARVQTCIMKFCEGFEGSTIFGFLIL